MILEKHSPQWVSDFNQIKQEIDSALQGLEYSIEHVGSTSVPYLDAKPIIDLDIIYDTNEVFGQIRLRLEEIGYCHNGNQGIVDREVFKRSGLSSNRILDTISHHLYVCPVDSKALERHLLSRDFLRMHEWARLKYQQLKYELAERAGQDRKKYAELKELHVNEFIDSIIEEERMNRT